jgi:predicted DNA-binding transcriptional regulator AlpA
MPKQPNLSHPQNAPETNIEVDQLLCLINKGGGEELRSLDNLKATGSHPFSNSTRHRKIRNNEYPAPIKISPQMCLWRVADIREWRNDPVGFKNKGAK